MGTTSLLSIPYPELTDDPNGPAQMQALAEGVETAITSSTKAFDSITLDADVTNISNSSFTTIVDLPVTTIGVQTLLISVQARALKTDSGAANIGFRVRDAAISTTIWRSYQIPLTESGTSQDNFTLSASFLYTTPVGGTRTLRLQAGTSSSTVKITEAAEGFNGDTYSPAVLSAVILV